MGAILVIILEFLGVIAKNPIFQKIALLGFFYSAITTVLTFFIEKLTIQIGLLGSVLNLSCFLGFTAGLNVFLSFLISGFIVKQVLAYIRS